MATQAPITPEPANEDACAHQSSPIAALFSVMLARMAIAIAAEHEIESADIFAPAFDHWLRDAEIALSNLSDTVCELIAMPVSGSTDQPLRDLAFMAYAVMGAENAEESDQARARCSGQLLRSMISNGGAHRLMLARGSALLSELITLDIYQHEPEAEGLIEGAAPPTP